MTRLLMTADAVGGVWTYACELARSLAPHGFSTTIATMGPAPTDDQLAAAHDVPALEIVSSRYQLEWMDDPWRDVEAAGQWLLDLEASLRPSVVHLNGYAHGAFPFRSPIVIVGHSCVLSWRDATREPIDSERLARYRSAAQAGLRAADWVIAPTAAMLESLQHYYGPLLRASVVSNARTQGRFKSVSKEPLVFAAGRLWDPAKNVAAVIDVAPRLSWPIVVAGFDAPSGAGVAANPGVGCSTGTGVRRLGRISEPEMAGWLARAAIFAHPARYEPFGLLPLEAALSGCALVLGDIPSLREIWDDAALFVPPDDRDALAGAIERLSTSNTLLRTFASRARAKALSYTPERLAKGYLAIYDHVTGGRGDFRCAS